MKHQLYIFFIIVLASGCATKDNGTIHIQCRKSFVFETNNEFNYYYVLNINNKTKEDIYLTNNGILFLQKNGEEKHFYRFVRNTLFLKKINHFYSGNSFLQKIQRLQQAKNYRNRKFGRFAGFQRAFRVQPSNVLC